jgi:triacylglycerol lipase
MSKQIAIAALGLVTGLCACMSPDDRVREEPLALASDNSSDYAATEHPLVLLPGILGFETMLGIVEYFPGVAEVLSEGGARVYIAYGSKANTSAVRAHQIIPQLEEIKAITGADRLNLIGHSQGAVDARIIAAERPDLVASITSIGGPHRGSFLADHMVSGDLTFLPGMALGALADLFTLITGATYPNDVDAALDNLTTAGMAELAVQYPAALPADACGHGAPIVDGVHYYSWGGVAGLTNPVDLLDPLWLLASFLGGGPNDGLIARCSTHLGEVIRDDYPQNHIDQTNMLFGLVTPFGPNPKALFRQQGNRLLIAGL